MHCLRLCLVFNPLSTVLLRLEVFCVQVGCVIMISLEAALQSGILWYPSVKQKVFISRKIYLFQKRGLPLQLRFSNLAMKNPKMMSSCFIFIYEQCLFTTTSWEDLAAVVFVSYKFMSIFLRCNLSCYCKSNFPASVGLFRDNKSP